MSLVKMQWLDAVSVVGATTEPEEVTGATRFSVQVIPTGSPTVHRVDLEGSIDGDHWVQLLQGGSDFTGGPGIYGYGGGATEDVTPRFIRLKLAALSGGTSPSVTAHLVAI